MSRPSDSDASSTSAIEPTAHAALPASGTPSKLHRRREQAYADDQPDEEVGDRLADEDLDRGQRTDAKELEQAEFAVAHQRQGGERDRQVLHEQCQRGRGEEVGGLDGDRHDRLGATGERSNEDRRVERGDRWQRIRDGCDLVGQRGGAGAGVLGPGAAELQGLGADARQPGQQVGSGVVIAGTQSFEHEVGALDQPRRVIDGVDDDVGLARHGLHVGLRGAVRELTRRAGQDRHQFVGGAEHGL